ncbi:MAG TPA: AAA family ATPase [Pirellulales bacterium]
MYEGFFGLSQRPFNSVCSVDHFVGLPSAEAARKTIRRAVERGEGPTLILGPAGSGKTLLCRTLARDLAPEFDVVMLANCLPTLARRELLQSVLFELGLPYKGLDEGELRLAIVETLLDVDSASRSVVMFVDEAHLLPVALLDELRQFGDVVVGGRPRMQLVLAGTIALEETFAHPHLEAFSQRIAARCYLTPLSRDDSRQLLANRMLAAGQSLDGIFTPEAVENLYRASDGVPRLLTQMADYALVLGATKRRRRIDGALIEEVWADLQQLPPPWAESRSSRKLAEVQAAQHASIEFGVLDEPTAPTSAPVAPAASPNHEDLGFASIEFGEPAPADAASDELSAEYRSVLDEHDAPAAPQETIEVLDAIEPSEFESIEFAGPATDITPAPPVSADGFYLDEVVVVDRYARLDSKSAGKPKFERRFAPPLALSPAESHSVAEAKPLGAAKVQEIAPVVATLHIAATPEIEEPSGADQPAGREEAEKTARQRRDAPQSIVAPVRRSEYRRMFARLMNGSEGVE